MTNEYAVFCARYNIQPNEAVYIPAIFENAAGKVELPVRVLINQATYTNKPLGAYLASVAKGLANDA